jgi:hemerythrin-like domain-containing protein
MEMAKSHTHESHEAESATEALKHEHRVIERVLAVIETLAEKPGTGSKAAWEKAIDFIRNFADKCHHLKEEQILFPALEEHGIPRDGGPVGMMLMEHEEGRALVRAMADAVGGAGADRKQEQILKENARAYLRLLREHIQKEDEILFKIADDVLPAEDQKRLAREFEQHEAAEIGSGVHESYVKVAEELEKLAR